MVNGVLHGEDYNYTTPILLLIFNRPNTSRRVFEIIRQQKPKYLFVAADGPRKDQAADIEKCKAARAVIKVDWECELQTLYRDENQGCGRGPAEAITWFFNHVEEGIILEDDMVPGPGFFEFMQQVLVTYRDDVRVNMVSGLNLVQRWNLNRKKPVFTLFGGTAGWGTWQRSWKYFDYEMNDWRAGIGAAILASKIKNTRYLAYFSELFDKITSQISNDFWDYQWLYARLTQGGRSIIPGVNLIENIGFGIDATHTIEPDHPQAFIRHQSLQLPLNLSEPRNNKLYDWFLFERFINPDPRSLFKKITLFVLQRLLTSGK